MEILYSKRVQYSTKKDSVILVHKYNKIAVLLLEVKYKARHFILSILDSFDAVLLQYNARK